MMTYFCQFFEVAMQPLNSNPDANVFAGLTIQVEDNKITGISKNGGRFGYLSLLIIYSTYWIIN